MDSHNHNFSIEDDIDKEKDGEIDSGISLPWIESKMKQLAILEQLEHGGSDIRDILGLKQKFIKSPVITRREFKSNDKLPTITTPQTLSVQSIQRAASRLLRETPISPSLPLSTPRQRPRMKTSVDRSRVAGPRGVLKKLPIGQQSLDIQIRDKMVKFISETFEERISIQSSHLLDVTMTALPGHVSYQLMHPIIYIREAIDVPAELVAWRTLKSMGAEEAVILLKSRNTDSEVKFETHREPVTGHPVRAAAQGARRWYAQRSNLPKNKIQLRSVQGASPLRQVTGPRLKKLSLAQSCMRVQSKTFNPLSSDTDSESEYSSSSDDEEDQHRKRMERSLMSRQLLWGADDSDNEAADQLFWKSTLLKTTQKVHHTDSDQLLLKESKKREMWDEMNRRRAEAKRLQEL